MNLHENQFLHIEREFQHKMISVARQILPDMSYLHLLTCLEHSYKLKRTCLRPN